MYVLPQMRNTPEEQLSMQLFNSYSRGMQKPEYLQESDEFRISMKQQYHSLLITLQIYNKGKEVYVPITNTNVRELRLCHTQNASFLYEES